MDRKAPIGILDTGVGGFTVVRALQQELPREDLVFYGDGKNVPYGNRSREEILHLVRQCLDFLAEKQVKLAAVACNTISALAGEFEQDYPFPIFSIVQAGSEEVAALRPEAVGVFSTLFTAQSGCYERCIRALAPQVRVYAQGSRGLAALIEEGSWENGALEEELDRSLGRLAGEHPELDTLVLGCTHFPIVQEQIQRRYPQFRHMIDPAWRQVEQIRRCLEEQDALNREGEGRLQIYTSGDCAGYERLAQRLGLRRSGPVSWVPAPVPLTQE